MLSFCCFYHSVKDSSFVSARKYNKLILEGIAFDRNIVQQNMILIFFLLFFLTADTGKGDSSLAERQRVPKTGRIRLADFKTGRLAQGPIVSQIWTVGVEKHILHTDENVERAVKGIYMKNPSFQFISWKFFKIHSDEQIAFETCKGSAVRLLHPIRYVTPEGDDHDSSWEGIFIPEKLHFCKLNFNLFPY